MFVVAKVPWHGSAAYALNLLLWPRSPGQDSDSSHQGCWRRCFRKLGACNRKVKSSCFVGHARTIHWRGNQRRRVRYAGGHWQILLSRMATEVLPDVPVICKSKRG